jgi:predicted HicB family RNase H-like nuclease
MAMSSTPPTKSSRSNTLIYKNFKADLRFGKNNEDVVVKLIGVPRQFRAQNRETAEKEFHRIVDQDLFGKLSAEEENLFDKDYSGNIALRMGPLLHQDLALAAHRSGKSLNAYIEDKLQIVLEKEALHSMRDIEPSSEDDVAVFRLLEDEEAASKLFQKIQPYLGDKFNLFQFPSALKEFLKKFSASLENIQPHIRYSTRYEFAKTVVELLQEFSAPVQTKSKEAIVSDTGVSKH